jgi:hypothetical protein
MDSKFEALPQTLTKCLETILKLIKLASKTLETHNTTTALLKKSKNLMHNISESDCISAISKLTAIIPYESSMIQTTQDTLFESLKYDLVCKLINTKSLEVYFNWRDWLYCSLSLKQDYFLSFYENKKNLESTQLICKNVLNQSTKSYEIVLFANLITKIKIPELSSVLKDILHSRLKSKIDSWPILIEKEMQTKTRQPYLLGSIAAMVFGSDLLVSNMARALLSESIPQIKIPDWMWNGWEESSQVGSYFPPKNYIEMCRVVLEQHLFTAIEIESKYPGICLYLYEKYGLTQYGTYGSDFLLTLYKQLPHSQNLDFNPTKKNVLLVFSRNDYNALRLYTGIKNYSNALRSNLSDINFAIVEFSDLGDMRKRIIDLSSSHGKWEVICIEAHGMRGSIHIQMPNFMQDLKSYIGSEADPGHIEGFRDSISATSTIVLSICASAPIVEDIAELYNVRCIGSRSITRLADFELNKEEWGSLSVECCMEQVEDYAEGGKLLAAAGSIQTYEKDFRVDTLTNLNK